MTKCPEGGRIGENIQRGRRLVCFSQESKENEDYENVDTDKYTQTPSIVTEKWAVEARCGSSKVS